MNPITVIIPVFNTERFIARAIESVLIQPEVDEIIVIDDGSSDNSIEIVRNLEKTNQKIKLLFHEHRANKGPAATRNLGIINAKNEWIAFLDADDYYLEGRFSISGPIINNQAIDGVYEAVIPEESSDNPLVNKVKSFEIQTLEKNIPPEKLFFESSPIGNKGLFAMNGFSARKSLLIKCGMFDENLRIGEDILLWLKLKIAGKLVGGSLEKPISVFVRHPNNITFGGDVAVYLIPVYKSLLRWENENISFKHKNITIDRLLFVSFHHKNSNTFTRLLFLIKTVLRYPYFILSSMFFNNLKHLLTHKK